MANNIDRHYIRIVLDGRRIENEDGGKGSGNFGHKGRPGLRGGSGKGGGKIYRTVEEGSASGYVGIQRAKAFKEIAEKAKKYTTVDAFVDSLSDSQWKQITDQRKACGTKEDNFKYAERLLRMLNTTAADLPYGKPSVVQGKDISTTWKRRPEKFAHAINDVINAQGFDGVPRIVSKAEFDKAVKESGFIAQRTYSATTPEELKGFRDQLYHGEWYVACTTGGAQYGQGMYCAADYKGELSDGIKTEMIHYINHYSHLGGEDKPKEEWVEQATRSANSILSMSVNSEVREWVPQHPDLVKQWAETYYDKDDVATKAIMKVMPDDVRQSLNMIFAQTPISYPQPHNVETFTLTPDAKVITYGELHQLIHGGLDEKLLSAEREKLIERVAKEHGLSDDELFMAKMEVGLLDYNGPEYERYTALQDKLDELPFNERRRLSWKIRKAKGQYSIERSEKEIEMFEEASEKARLFRERFQGNSDDEGVIAAALGYDAINAEGHGESDSYTVVLNRTKCIFLDPDDPAGEEYWGYSKVS